MAAWGTHVLLFIIAHFAAALSDAPEECAQRDLATAEEDGSQAGVSMLQHTGSLSPPTSAEPAPAGSKTARGRPNIVLFLPDDMYLDKYPIGDGEEITPRFPDALPFADRPIPTDEMMPKLEVIARTGATFSRAYSTSSTCTPSRYSIITGRYPSRSQFGHGFTGAVLSSAQLAFVGEGVTFFGEDDTNENIAQTLRSVGYTAGMVGKWGLTSQADDADYDIPYPDLVSLVQRLAGFDFVDGLYIQNQNMCTAEICSQFSHNMEWQIESALRFMDGAMRQDLPFFLYFAATLPHHSPEASDALLGLFNSSQTPAGVLSEPPDIFRYCSSCTLASHETIWNASIVAPTANKRSQMAALRWVDESLGVIYDFLSERGAIDNTYLVISTDHGPVKGTLYEMGTRVPLYVVGPGIAAGTRVTEMVSHVDMAPTFMDWAGCGSGTADCSSIGLEELDGLSWASLVSGKAASLDRHEIYFEAMLDRAVLNKDGMKFILRQTDNIESFLNASADRSELDTRLVDLSRLSNAYPACNASEQVYTLIGDGLEQVNLIPDSRRLGAVNLAGLHKFRDLILAHDAMTYASETA